MHRAESRGCFASPLIHVRSTKSWQGPLNVSCHANNSKFSLATSGGSIVLHREPPPPHPHRLVELKSGQRPERDAGTGDSVGRVVVVQKQKLVELLLLFARRQNVCWEVRVSQLANCVEATRGDTRWLHGGGGGGGGESLAELNEPQLAELGDVPGGPSTRLTPPTQCA